MIIFLQILGEPIEKLLDKNKSADPGGQLQNGYMEINSFPYILTGIGWKF